MRHLIHFYGAYSNVARAKRKKSGVYLLAVDDIEATEKLSSAKSVADKPSLINGSYAHHRRREHPVYAKGIWTFGRVAHGEKVRFMGTDKFGFDHIDNGILSSRCTAFAAEPGANA
jgi:hypothetical protein